MGLGCKYTTKAQGFLHSLTSGRTIIALVILNHVLDIVKGLSAKLQKRDADIVMAYKYIDLACYECDTSWNDWYWEAEDLVRKVGNELKIPRITTYQQHRLNTPSETSSQYFKRTICIPFLDTFSLQLDEKFSADNRTIQSLFSLVLKIIVSLNDGDIDLLVEKLHFWETHISSPLALRNEIVRWKKYWEEDKNKDYLPDSLINALTYADPDNSIPNFERAHNSWMHISRIM